MAVFSKGKYSFKVAYSVSGPNPEWPKFKTEFSILISFLKFPAILSVSFTQSP